MCVILDNNKSCEPTLALPNAADKWKSFGWNVETADGHDIPNLLNYFDNIDFSKPNLLVANTIKGKGVSYMEGIPTWHGSLKLSKEDLSQALLELGEDKTKIKEYFND